MAKNKITISGILYIIMSVMAMNFLALGIYLIVALQLGFINTTDLEDMAWVLVGNRKYAMTKEQITEYNELVSDREKRYKELTATEGSDDTRNASAAALNEMRKQLEERIRALRELRNQHEQRLSDLRERIERLKQDYVKEKNNLEAWKIENTKASLDEKTAKMGKTLRALDPELIANYFLSISPYDSARSIESYLTPDITAEVMAALPADNQRQILPLLENKYAGMSPAAIAKAWTTPGTNDYKNSEQMAEYMKKMTVPQAFTIFTLMEPRIRADLVRLLKSTNGNGNNN